jgi:NAD(P)-dependent dehydrogenase (short-subunit alcohol dehydrogenase family)
VATVLIIGESRGIGLETVRAALRGFGAGDSRGYGGFLYSLGFHLLLGRVYDDKDVQERIVRSSKLDWVIVRPVILTDGPKTNAYRALIDPLAGDADSSRAPTWRILSLSRFTTTRLSA